jgi:hypothetical protein
MCIYIYQIFQFYLKYLSKNCYKKLDISNFIIKTRMKIAICLLLIVTAMSLRIKKKDSYYLFARVQHA